MEKHPDSLPVVAERLIQQGVTRLLIVPLLLFSAMHAEEDIPQQLAPLKERYPQLDILLTPTFAQEREVLAVLAKNLTQAVEVNCLAETTPVLLVAHGSSTYGKPAELVKDIGERLSQLGQRRVVTGVLYGQKSYTDVAQQLLAEEPAVLILPFFLFDGHLLDKIKGTLGTLTAVQTEEKALYYGKTLALDPSLTIGIGRLIDQVWANG